jgi:hypothetical protein
VVIDKLNISTELTERDLTTPYVLQMASGEIPPIFKETLVKLALGRLPLMTLIFVSNITDEFIHRLDTLTSSRPVLGPNQPTIQWV